MGDIILLKDPNSPMSVTTEINTLSCVFDTWGCRGGFLWDPDGTTNIFADNVQIGPNFGHIHSRVWDPTWNHRIEGFRGEVDFENPDGDWNQLVAVADGDKIDIYFNGMWVNSVRDVFPTSGQIQLQLEWSEYFVRRFELLPLNSNVSPIISTRSIPSPELGVYFDFALDAEAINSPVSWSHVTGELPDGLFLEEVSGTIYGVPVESGSFTFTISVEDSVGEFSQETYTVVIP